MIDGQRVLALIPARGGSKTVPRKNLHNLGGKPLLAWPIEVALATRAIDRVVVSTDDDEIAATAKKYGAEVDARPEHLAGDTAVVADLIRELRGRLRAAGESARYLVLLEPTSPFRTAEDVELCLRRLREEALDSIATFCEASTNPFRAWRIEGGRPYTFIRGAVPWRPRQQLPPAYQLTGAVYAFDLDKLPEDSPSILFGRMGAVLIDRSRSVDIDDETDFQIAEAILRSAALA